MSIQFINRLKSIMKERKITQTELAKRTGIRQSSISDWLNDRFMMRIFQQMSNLLIIIWMQKLQSMRKCFVLVQKCVCYSPHLVVSLRRIWKKL